VKRYPQAIAQLRGALKASREPLALRGLSQALVETKANLDEARALAEELIALDPASEQGHEALLRVCLATGDDACAFEQFKLANGARDLSLRWLVLRDELLEPAKAAAARLRGGAQPRATETGPCAAETSEPEQALCLVKRCLSEGTQLYAKALSEQNREEYRVAGWSARAAAPGKVVVSRPILAANGEGTHAPIWVVRERGDHLVIAPSNTPAQQIMASYNRCTSSPGVLR
jgi:hypothetical protein